MGISFKDLARIIPAYAATGRAITIRSAPGTGKTEFAQSIPRILKAALRRDYKVVEIFCPNVEYNDLAGLQFKKNFTRDNREYAVADPTVPYWAMLDDGSFAWEHPYGVVILEEHGQAGPDVKKTLANLKLQKRINNWQLPEGWFVVSLANRASDRSGVTKDFDHDINRSGEYEVDASVLDWVDWANDNGVHPLLVSFAQENPQIVFAGEAPDKQGPWCTPRSLVMLGELYATMSDDPEALPMDAVAQKMAVAHIGEAAAAQLISTIRLAKELPSFRDIVAKPDTCRVPQAIDAMMLVAYKLAAMVDEDTFGPVTTYMNRFPKEFAVTFLKAACARNGDLVNTAAFGEWAIDNASLVNALRDAA